LPEFRGRGVGRKLVVESLKTLKARGVKAVRLNFFKENKAAVKLYRRLGFKTRNYGMEKTLENSSRSCRLFNQLELLLALKLQE